MALNYFILTKGIPAEIYLDTCFLVYALSGNPPERLSRYGRDEVVKFKQVVLAKTFLGRLLEESQTVKVSSMLIPEYWRSNLINAVVEKERVPPWRAVRRIGDNPKNYIKKYYSCIENANTKLESFFKKYKHRITVVESSEAISREALKVMGKYLLDSYDAIHIGAMIEDGFTNFATGDNDIVDRCKDAFEIWTYPSGYVLDDIYNICLESKAYKVLFSG